jgi:hypothetical protein
MGNHGYLQVAARRCLGWRPGLQSQMREEPPNHRGLQDGHIGLPLAAALQAAQQIPTRCQEADGRQRRLVVIFALMAKCQPMAAFVKVCRMPTRAGVAVEPRLPTRVGVHIETRAPFANTPGDWHWIAARSGGSGETLLAAHAAVAHRLIRSATADALLPHVTCYPLDGPAGASHDEANQHGNT